MGSALVGDIIKRTIQGGVDWAKKRQSAKPVEVEQKAAELIDKELDKVITKAPELANIPAERRQEIVTEITSLTLPTFKQVIHFSENTHRVVTAAQRPGGRKALKKAVPLAKKRYASKKAPAKKFSAKRVGIKKR